ncbi:MAG: hypothetical protein NTY53_25510 [Kiritimatiellaeota bacterium]|nr:hypothetical protein [Kiritimatiellota bacterium]
MKNTILSGFLLILISVSCTSTHPTQQQAEGIQGKLDDHVTYAFVTEAESVKLQIFYDKELLGWFECFTNAMCATLTSLKKYDRAHYDDMSICVEGSKMNFIRSSFRGDTFTQLMDLDGDGLADVRGTLTSTNRLKENISHSFTVRSSSPRQKTDEKKTKH